MNGEPLWLITRDGDPVARRLFDRHYSRVPGRIGKPGKFIGPGEYLALRTDAGDALFVWRKFIDDSGQAGINCAVFRNEGPSQSSSLIRQADACADLCWPRQRHYTYVDGAAVRSRNPGWCFICAGWRRCGVTKGGLIILEREPRQNSAGVAAVAGA